MGDLDILVGIEKDFFIQAHCIDVLTENMEDIIEFSGCTLKS